MPCLPSLLLYAAQAVDILIVNCSLFNPTPSLSGARQQQLSVAGDPVQGLGGAAGRWQQFCAALRT